MKEIRNRNKIGFNPIVLFKAPVSHKLYRQLTSLMMSIVISTVTVLGNTTVALADKKDDVINRIIEQYENGDISRDDAKRALIKNGVTNSPIIDLNEDEEGNEIATDSDLVKKLGEKDRLIDEKIRKIIEDNRDDDTSVVFAWHNEDVDSIMDELDVATKSELKKSEAEADDNQASKKSVGIYYDKFNKTSKSSETADSETESENIEEAVDTEDDVAVDEESVSEGEVSDENQASEEMMEDDSLDEENEDSNSVDEDEVFENDSQDNESEDFDSAEEDEVSENDSQDEEDEVFESVDPYAFFMNQLQADENETIESVEENEGFENNSQDEEDEVSESVNPYEFFMNQFQNEETEVSDSVEEDEVSEDDSQDEEDEKEDEDSVEEDEVFEDDSHDEEDEEEDSDSVKEDKVFGNDSQHEEDEEKNSDSVETSEADENKSEDEEKEENSNLIKVDKFFEIDSYVENEDSDSENSEEETTEAETEAAKAIGILAHSDKNAIAQTVGDAEAEVDADAETEAETETKAAKAIGILAHSDKTAIALTEENKDSADEEKDYDVIDLSEYVTVSSAVKKFHEEWIESESFDSGNKIGLTLYFSIPEDVMYDKDTRVAAYSMPEGLTSQFEGKGKVISGDETVGTYKLKKNEIEITFDTAFVKSGKSIEGALFFKGRVENNTDEDCLTIELGGTAGSLDVYKEIKKTVVSDDGKVKVTATFSASTFSSDVTLHAESLDDDASIDIENAFNEKLQKEERKVSDMFIYDVFFLDEEGEKIEPDGHVSVKMTFNNPIESDEEDEIKVFHVKNNDLSDIEDLTSMEDTVINENSKGEVKHVELVTESFSPMGIVISESGGVERDILEFLSDMSITGAQQDGNTWIVKNKTPYYLYLTFNEVSGGIQFPNNDTWMYYEIPDGLYIEDTGSDSDFIVDANFNVIEDIDKDIDEIKYKGKYFDVIIDNKYKISKNQLVVDEESRRLYFQWNTTNDNFKHLKSATNVSIVAEMSGYLDKEEVNIEFPNGVTKTIKIDNNHHVSINKWAYYNDYEKKIHYTVQVNSSGVSENVKVTDTIAGSLIHLDTNSDFTVTSNKGSISYEVKTKSNKGFTITIPKMKDGESVEIKYLAKFGTIPDDAVASYDTIGNTAKVTASDDTGDEKKYTLENFSSLTKYTSGVSNVKWDSEDGNPYSIVTYKIKANEERIADISSITDIISEDSRPYMTYMADDDEYKYMRVYVNDPNGDKDSIHINWKDNPDLKLMKDKNGRVYGWTWTVPEEIKEKYGANASYYIKYYTKVLRSYTDKRTMKNTVTTNHHGDVTNEKEIGTISHSNEVGKEAVSFTNDNIVWKLTFTVPEDGLDYVLIKDSLPYVGYEFKEKLDEKSIVVNGLVGDETYRVGDPYIDTHTDSNGNPNGEGYRFNIAFFKDKNKDTTIPSKYKEKTDNCGLTGTGKVRTITITYTSVNDENWIRKTTDSNSYNTYKTHKNTAHFYVNNWDAYKSDEVIITESTLKKTGYIYYDNNIPYVTEDGYYIFAYEISFSSVSGDYPDDLTFTDTYDERLSFLDKEIPGKIEDNGGILRGNVWSLWKEGNEGKADINVDEDKHQLTIKIPKESLPLNGSGTYYDAYGVRYYLMIKKTEAIELALKNKTESKGSVTFSNKVQWGDTEAEKNITYDYQILDKDGSYDEETGLANYTLVINPNKDTLNEEKVMKLLDEFENQIIDISTFNITEEGLDGVKKENESIKYSIEGNKLTFKNIPDRTKITITYSALPVLTSKKVTLTNKATLLWSHDETRFEAKFDVSAQGSGSTLSLKLVKHEKGDDSTLLEGAVFDLYKVDDAGNDIKDSTGKTQCKGTPIKDSEGNPIRFTTGEDGVAEISLTDIDTEEKFAYGQKYCLVESKAPKGYTKDRNNVYYFAFGNPETSEFRYESEDPLYPKGYVLSIANEKNIFELPDTGSVGVNIMYLIGTMMVALGGLVLVLKRRKEQYL